MTVRRSARKSCALAVAAQSGGVVNDLDRGMPHAVDRAARRAGGSTREDPGRPSAVTLRHEFLAPSLAELFQVVKTG
ncbi:MAG TPA: hypothetical protein VJ914_13460 [Pseudonocardiaceae bacterium]|nr:hypothetical protein [Pseudonocardiaceae bacterium]